MEISLIYQGKRINDDVNISKCYLYDRLGGMADSIDLSFPDGEKLWVQWGVQKGDEISVKADTYPTGKMYIDTYYMESGNFIIKTTSTPIHSKKVKSKIWRDVKLHEVINDVASSLGLSVKTYDIEDFTYRTIMQREETDLQMLNRVCMREGYAVKIHDGSLLVFNEKALEAGSNAVSVAVDDVFANYRFKRSDSLLSSYTVTYQPMNGSLITAIANDANIQGGSGKTREFLDSVSEAERFSKGYLRSVNKKAVVGYLPMEYNPNISAGSLIDCTGFKEFDGRYIVSSIMHDVLGGVSYVEVRNTLTY